GLDVARHDRQRSVGQDHVTALEQLAAHPVALILNVGGRRRQVDPLPREPSLGGRHLPRMELPQRLQDLADVVRQVIYALEEPLFEDRSKGLVELAYTTRLRIQLEEFEAQKR